MIELSRAEGKILGGWQEEAARKITDRRDPVVAHRVIERVAQTVADDIRVNLVDNVDGFSRIRVRRSGIGINLTRTPDSDAVFRIISRLDKKVFDCVSQSVPQSVLQEPDEIFKNRKDNGTMATALRLLLPGQMEDLADALNGEGDLTDVDLDATNDGLVGLVETTDPFHLAIRKLIRSLVTDEGFRASALQKMGWIPMVQDKLLCAALIRQGLRTLLNTGELTEREFWHRARHEEEEKAESDRDPGVFARAASFLESPGSPDPEWMPRRLIDRIDAYKYRVELARLKKLAYVWPSIDAKEKEIAFRVFGEVDLIYRDNPALEREPSYVYGRPPSVVNNSCISCFSGPWLQAALMMACGIDYENMLLGRTHKTADRVLGGHNFLLLKTEYKYLIRIDPAEHIIDDDFAYKYRQNKQTIDEMNHLMNGMRAEPVSLKFPKILVKNSHYPYEMQAMKLGTGLSSVHMLHVGIEFLHERKLAEAEYAFEMALSFNAYDPDAWYYLGLVYFFNGNAKEAKRYFEKAIECFDEHLWSYFALGEMAVAEGNVKLAKEYFEIVAGNKCAVFGDYSFVTKAHIYGKVSGDALKKMFKKR